MGSKTYRPEFDQSRFDNAQTGGDYYRQLAESKLVPQIIERQKQALNVVPEEFLFYQRAYTGRRCSCFGGISTSPSSACLVCFGTGNTAGYQLYGHNTEALDATAPASAMNVVLDFDQVTTPLSFRLLNQVTKGYIDYVLPVSGGVNACSLASLHVVAPRGSRVRAGVKLFTESVFTDLSTDAVTERLAEAQTTGGLHFRIVLERSSICAESPRFQFLRIRYKTLDQDRVRGDVPLSSESNTSSELGWYDSVESKSLYLDNTLRSISSEDLFREMRTGRLFKVEELTPNFVAGLLTSWTCNLRKVQDSERYSFIP